MARAAPGPLPRPAAPRRGNAAPSARCRKARDAGACERLEQIPNVGPSIAAALRQLGIVHPRELATHDAFALYRRLCRATGQRQDPCVLDTFMAAVDFMRGAPARPWWVYTAERKRLHGSI